MLIRQAVQKIKVATLSLVLASCFAAAIPAATALAEPHACGNDSTAYTPSIELGCRSKGNAILDLLFAVIRFLSYGVGLVITGSLIYAGIQYTGSRGDPNANAQAVKRIQANVSALLLFVFAYAIINYIVPGHFLR